jgi:hypothetical protein
MKSASTALLLAIAMLPAEAQQFREGEAIVGVIGQHDTQLVSGVRLSPVGLNIGFIVQPMFGSRRVAVVEQISFFPITHYQKQTNPFGEPYNARTNPFILNTLWLRLSSGIPESSGRNMFFAAGGLGVAVSTPRDGHKLSPMISIGARRWLQRQVGFEVALQCGALEIGRTWCVLPVTSTWPF